MARSQPERALWTDIRPQARDTQTEIEMHPDICARVLHTSRCRCTTKIHTHTPLTWLTLLLARGPGGELWGLQNHIPEFHRI